jgi:Cu(I)/Ag(I) efflux system membrane fusion protein
LAQRTCPVTGDLVGSDGKPMKVQLRGRTVFVCCEGCNDDLKANPQNYLANRP